MKQEFGLTGMTQWDSSTGATYVGVSISVPRIFHNPSPEWKQYLVECRKSLDRVAAQESIEIQEWSTNLTFEDGLTRITHHVFAYGELTGATPNLLQWALAPARDYETLDILARALHEGVLIESHLKRAAECNCPRYDHDGKLLPEAIPTLLLAMALSTPGWRGLVCPSDNPWAYINKTTQLIYQRYYATGNGTADPQGVVAGTSRDQNLKESDSTTIGDELVVENIFDIVQNSECSTDATIVEIARAQGKKWNELPEYLIGLTGTCWDRRRVETARGSFRRQKGKLRAAALAGSNWKPRPNGGSVYRERVPDGAAWNGLWTYSHTLQGDDLEIYREVMFNERKKLFRAE